MIHEANAVGPVSTALFQLLSGNQIIMDFVGYHETLKIPQIYNPVSPEGAKVPFITVEPGTGKPVIGGRGRRILDKNTVYN